MTKKQRIPMEEAEINSALSTEKTASETTEQDAERGTSVVWGVMSSLILTAAIGLCVFISVQISTNGYVSIAGLSMFRVVTGSMEPTIAVGEAILCQKAPISEIQVNDIVCYRSEFSEIKGAVVTHRVIEIMRDRSGALVLKTQGDANIAADPHLVGANDLVGRVIWYSGKESVLTRVLSFLTGKIGFLACIVFPTMLAAGLILQSSVRSLRQEMRRVRRELDEEEAMRSHCANVSKEENRDGTELVPGYTTLTRKEYDEILEAVKAELIEEQKNATPNNKEETTE